MHDQHKSGRTRGEWENVTAQIHLIAAGSGQKLIDVIWYSDLEEKCNLRALSTEQSGCVLWITLRISQSFLL